MSNIIIRADIDKHMAELRQWLDSIKDEPLEKMDEFFTNRLDIYEEHMSGYRDAYLFLPRLLPEGTQTLLDIGCGTGLELDEIFKFFPDLSVTGIDLTSAMLDILKEKHSDKNMTLICGDYFEVNYNKNYYDAAISFETLHHFKPGKKLDIFKKLYDTLKPGGIYIECDYIACCEEEEELCLGESEKKRRAKGVPDDIFVHFDIPLTAEHEISLLKSAGFSNAELIACYNGVSVITASALKEPEAR